ncbi:Cu(I)-responsive transcriptional regulator [Thorsellia kenyensis]|uniref:HTH-type transcriptional regulator CueR n=1 Tax=Thorsellia kenyensis TaxID=1549888 RepID=A0ABV6C7X3_9GAMM
MKIGEIAKKVGVSAKSIRHYEDIGLIAAPIRAKNGYRYYDQTHFEALRLIKKSRFVGFTLEECKTLLELWASPNRKSKEVNATLLKKIDDIDAQIKALLTMKSMLTELSNQCPNDDTTYCPIISTLIK